MTSPSCLFNAKLFFKSLLQQRYVMIVHTVVLLLATTVPAFVGYTGAKGSSSRYTDYLLISEDVFNNLTLKSPFVVMLILAAGFVTAYLGFYHLFKKSSAVFFGAMPVKRGCMYVTKLCACLVSVIIPVVIGLAVNLSLFHAMDFEGWNVQVIGTGEFFAAAGYVMLQYLLHTGVFVLAACLSGNVFAQLIFTGFVFLAYPVVYLITSAFVETQFQTWNAYLMPDVNTMFPSAALFGDFGSYIPLSIAVAVISAVLAFLAYRHRRIENTDGFYVFRFVGAVLKYFISVCAGLVGGLVIGEYNNDSSAGIFVGGIIFSLLCFCVIQGIFEKSFKAMFANLKGFASVVCITVILIVIPVFDPFGIDDMTGIISSVRIQPDDIDYIYFYSLSHEEEFAVELTTSENVKAAKKLVRTGLEYTPIGGDEVNVALYPDSNMFGFTRSVTVSGEDYEGFKRVVYNSSEYREGCAAAVESLSTELSYIVGPLSGEPDTPYKNKEFTEAEADRIKSLLAEDIRTTGYDEAKASGVFCLIVFEEPFVILNIPVYFSYTNTVEYLTTGRL